MRAVATNSTTKERYEALRRIMDNKRAIEAFMSYRKAVKPKQSSESNRDVLRSESLALNRRDLPKFQLSSSAVKAFPTEEVFESVDHYLRTFKSILHSSSLDLETQWSKLLPLCMPNGDRAWEDKTLLKCSSRAEAKQVLAHRFGSAVITRRNTDLVFTMTMKASHSIMDYSCRFQQAMYNAGLQLDDPRVADRFYAHATASLPGSGESAETDKSAETDDVYPKRRGFEDFTREFANFCGGHSSFKCVESGGIFKKYHCEQHGPNDSQGTKKCQCFKFNKKAQTEEKCINCWKQFERGHDCSHCRAPDAGPSFTLLNREASGASIVPSHQ